MSLVRIVWRDSGLSHESGWRTAAQVENRTAIVTTVGFVIHEDDENVTLAMGRADDPALYFGIHTVWKPSIQSMEELCAPPTSK